MKSSTVPATLDSLGPIADYVMAAAAAAGLDRRASYRLRLAVDEIATNIMGYVRDTCNFRPQRGQSRNVDVLGQTIHSA
jgi:anti-sigma regulatory factor (Ser/Thr protein kinase)